MSVLPSGLLHGHVTERSPADNAQRQVEVRRRVIKPRLIDDALRALHLDLLERGAQAAEFGEWLWGAHWFPHLVYDPRILALAEGLPAAWREGARCDPQILLQFPHVGPKPDITFHVDQEPAWADGRRYLRIVGVPLSRWEAANGGLLIRPVDRTIAVELEPGDAVMMGPEMMHTGGINTTGSIRYGVYFRWLEELAPADGEAPRSQR